MDSILAYKGLSLQSIPVSCFITAELGSKSGVPAWRWQIVLGRKTEFCTLDAAYLFGMHRRYEMRLKAI